MGGLVGGGKKGSEGGGWEGGIGRVSWGWEGEKGGGVSRVGGRKAGEGRAPGT